MKVIDALQKIANGEEIKFKLICAYEIYSLNTNKFLVDENNKEVSWYINEEWLNEEIEMIEEPKKIENISDEELEQCDGDYDRICLILDKLDELIDYINDKENK